MTALGEASVERLSVGWGRRSGWGPIAVLGVVAIAIHLETVTPRLDHGTHLLVALAAVLAIVLVLGPKAAAAGLVLAAAVASLGSALGEHEDVRVGEAYVQMAAYLLAGSMAILVVSLALGPRAAMEARGRRGRPRQPVPLPSGAVPVGPERLTERELEILRLAATGISVTELSRLLYISENTVKTHLTHVYAKLAVRGRTDAVRAALHAGWLTPNDICPHRMRTITGSGDEFARPSDDDP